MEIWGFICGYWAIFRVHVEGPRGGVRIQPPSTERGWTSSALLDMCSRAVITVLWLWNDGRHEHRRCPPPTGGGGFRAWLRFSLRRLTCDQRGLLISSRTYSGARFGWTCFGRTSDLLGGFFWMFMYIFAGLAPLVQLRG